MPTVVYSSIINDVLPELYTEKSDICILAEEANVSLGHDKHAKYFLFLHLNMLNYLKENKTWSV